MLVIAPLRVARQTWPAEIAKWQEFSHLRAVVLHGPRKDDYLKKADGDVYLINPEGLKWLCRAYFGRPLPFDVVVIDELTKFKNSRWPAAKGWEGATHGSSGGSERGKEFIKAMRRQSGTGPRWRWGLTGSLAGDGTYLDVFGQQLALDDGAALGRYITHYRDRYFIPNFEGFSYDLKLGAKQEILEKLAPYWFYVSEADYSQLPPIVDTPIMIDLEADQMRLYHRMRDAYIATLPDKVITAANAGAAYAKLAQMANGAIYDDARAVHFLHDAKIDALDDLVEELNGEPLLVSYEFRHDLARIQAWHRKRFNGREVAVLRSGQSAAKEAEVIAAWSARQISILAVHPKSAGHGLNLQEGNAANICHFSLPWSYEEYDQLVRRVWRDGNAATRVFNHMFIVRGTVDEDKLAARNTKAFTQGDLIRILNSQILREQRETQTSGDRSQSENETMVARLSRPGEAPPPAQQGAQGQPAGWAPPLQSGFQGAQGMLGQGPQGMQGQGPQGWQAPQQGQGPQGWQAPPNGGAPSDAEQRARIQQQIAPSPQEQVNAAFGSAAQQQAAAIAGGDYGPVASAPPAGWQAPAGAATPAQQAETAKRGRRTNAQIAADEAAAKAQQPGNLQAANSAIQAPFEPQHAAAAILTARAECLKIAFADPTMQLDDGFEIADRLWGWLNKM